MHTKIERVEGLPKDDPEQSEAIHNESSRLVGITLFITALIFFLAAIAAAIIFNPVAGVGAIMFIVNPVVWAALLRAHKADDRATNPRA